MAKRKSRAKAQTETPETIPDTGPVTATVGEAENTIAVGEPQEPASEAANPTPVYAADPSAKITVGLSDYRGGPRMHLLRSHKFNQMQIRFDGDQPGDQYLAILAKAGWKDRTEAEGVWTKQIDRNRRWQSVQQMEFEFREVANAIRRDKRLSPTLQGLA